MRKAEQTITKFDTTRGIERARSKKRVPIWMIPMLNSETSWSSPMERMSLMRKGLPYESIEVISKRAGLPVKQFLEILGMPQTTYNKKKRDGDPMTGRDSEVILVLAELLDFGIEVFNDENEKFQRWLKKPNLSLGSVKPESLFDSVTGIQEVKNSLNRLEYGNMA